MERGKPGAGLPPMERYFIKYFMLPIVRLLFTWEIPLLLLKREIRKIDTLTRNLSQHQLQRRLLIEKVFAIEDHSRDFSVNMVLEHLSIAGEGVFGIIDSLSHERPFEQEITVQGVKPTGETKDARMAFASFMEHYEARIAELPKKHSKTTKRHPWFVEFNNFDWRAFMYLHTFIHRRQIEAILAKQEDTP